MSFLVLGVGWFVLGFLLFCCFCVCVVLKTPRFLLSPILQHVGIAYLRQNVLMTVWASSAHGMSPKKKPLSPAKLPVSYPFSYPRLALDFDPTDFCHLRRRSNYLICLIAHFWPEWLSCSVLLQFIYVQLRNMLCWLKGALPGTFFARRSHSSSKEQKKRLGEAKTA